MDVHLLPSFFGRALVLATSLLLCAPLVLGFAGCGDEETPAPDVSQTLDAGDAGDAALGDDTVSPDASVPDAVAGDAAPDGASEGGFALCEDRARVGTFELNLLEEYTTVVGQVANGVSPFSLLETVAAVGDCRFARPVNYFCDPTCIGGETCTSDGECVPSPSNVSVGAVAVTGASGDFEMGARAPVYVYTFNGDLPHPAFDDQSMVELSAEGDEGIAGFVVVAAGVDVLTSAIEAPTLAAGQPLTLSWEAADEASRSGARILVDVNIANHGGAPGRIECETEDDGEVTIDATLVDALLANGYSGFPSLVLSRVGGGAVETDLGCVDLRLVSERVFAVVIPGLTSCSNDEDCPDGETCQPDLSCG